MVYVLRKRITLYVYDVLKRRFWVKIPTCKADGDSGPPLKPNYLSLTAGGTSAAGTELPAFWVAS